MSRRHFHFGSFLESSNSEQTSERLSLPRIASFIALLCLVVPMVQAQGTGNISGYVRDPSGAAVPGASVTAVMNEQQTTRTRQSDAQGFYNFVELPAGHYTLTFESKGFSREVHPDVELMRSWRWDRYRTKFK
jgi:hypothetical protein